MADRTAAAPMAAVFGLAGLRLSGDERRLFADSNPCGFILFARNCEEPRQVRRLVDELKSVSGRADTPILIDQEGGRVQRLKPPHWRAAPPPSVFGRLAARDERAATEAVFLNARLIGAELADLGITVDCMPVLDLEMPGADPIIGDRSFGSDPDRVALLGRAACAGMLAQGVLPVIKHIPGHGRAACDSHLALPRVASGEAELTATDFAPFAALNEMPWAMTAHVVYEALDADAAATVSATVIGRVVRGAIGFEGVLVSDDLGMGALSGPLAARTRAALAAGCDLVLHCSGAFAEMAAVAEACPPLTAGAQTRLDRAERIRAAAREPFDALAALGRLEALLEAGVA